jgi:outer membrane protein assembly factor BamE (lipoprotein component of BamABCDE complex)
LAIATAACVLVPALSGCTVSRMYEGVPLRARPEVIREGETTKAEVLHLFGPPERVEHQTDGDAFVYTYRQRNYSSITAREPFFGLMIFSYSRQFNDDDTLVVLFDFYGKVRAVAFEENTPEMPAL